MEMRIIGAALSLVLVYLILSLLTSHLSELFSSLWGGRGETMERMVQRVFIGQENRVPDFWAYAPIAALSKPGDTPSAIPPDLFAKAYLAVINGGVPPSEAFRSPHEFVESLDRAVPTAQAGAAKRPKGAGPASASTILQLQKAGARDDWDAFEANLATWISDIGDRIDGTYKRWKALGLLCTAGVLAFIVDADTFRMIDTFLSDDEVRGAFSNIAILADDQHRGTPASQAASTPLSPSASPFERTSRAARDFATAMGSIRSALKDSEIQAFGINRDDVSDSCGGDLSDPKLELYASNSDVWVVLMPEIVRRANEISLGVTIRRPAVASSDASPPRAGTTKNKERVQTVVRPASAAASNAQQISKFASGTVTRPAAVPASGDPTTAPSSAPMSAKTEENATPVKAPASEVPLGEKSPVKRFADWMAPPPPTPSRRPTLEGCQLDDKSDAVHGMSDCERSALVNNVLACVNVVHSWVALAQPIAHSETARKDLSHAMDALEEGMTLLHQERTRIVGGEAFARRYLSDPEQFESCAEQSGDSRASFDACLDRSSQVRLPFGWQNARLQLCEAHAVMPLVDEAADARQRVSTLQVCPAFASDEALGLPRIETVFSAWRALITIIGILLTALMVSLGAPFWWSVLGKVADLRLAGGVRGLKDSANVDPGRALTSDSSGTSVGLVTDRSASRPGGGPTGADTPADRARNAFERTLRVQDVGRIQKVLQVPPTGRLDDPTRDAIQRFLQGRGMDNVRELSAQTYTMITTRQAPVASDAVVGPTGDWRRGQAIPADARSELVQALKRVLPSEDKLPAISPVGTTFDDDLRARVVLYRALSDMAAFPDKAVTAMSRRAAATLGQLDDSLRQRILADKTTYQRSTPTWLDVAVGELGITEDGREAQSDPRVCQYIQALETLPVAGDQTPWCGAFLGWVMTQAELLDTNWTQNKGLLMRALNWQEFGKAVDLAASNPPNVPQGGDICVLQTAAGHHVGLWIAGDAKQGWILGGNQGQSGSGGVTLVQWSLQPGTIVAARRVG